VAQDKLEKEMRGRTYLLVCSVGLGLIGVFLAASGGCPFFPLFTPILIGTPCELTQTGSIGLILSATGGALVIAVEIAQRLKPTGTDREPLGLPDEDKE